MKFLKWFLDTVVYIAVVILLTFLMVKFVAQRTEVFGTSMVPTLESGDQLIADKLTYHFRDPRRFEIVIFPFEYEEETYFIKRVIGLPGETVRIDFQGNIYIDGKLLEEDYGYEVMESPGIAAAEITLADDEYFVLGDNRNVSKDSRSADVGPISRDVILGRAFLRIYPFSKFSVMLNR
ncbi:MAG: signal peptidase I [Lachnospiraceae bacterium]|nr:signal peptidase I [Lachnospiraceae bacterium]